MEKEEVLNGIYRCAKCKLCTITSFHPREELSPICPSGEYYGFQAFYAPGRLEILKGILDDDIEESDELLKIIYSCTLCGACYEKCKEITKVDLNFSEIFEEMREIAVEKGWVLDAHKDLIEKIRETHNAYGEVQSRYQRKEGDILYFVGCTSRYREKEISESMIELLDKLNVNFQILEDEWCCGSTLLRIGQVEEAKELIEHNIDEIKRSGAKTIVFTCPGCLMTFKKNYPRLNVELLHSTQFIERLNPNLKLKNLGIDVAYHDPCHLGRHLGIYEEPREILSKIVNIREMKRNREQSWCCGSGGGVRSAFEEFSSWSASERIKEAREVADTLVSACPFCKHNLNDNSDGMKVYDVVELVNRALE
jgi:Fe-S oxidoreductase